VVSENVQGICKTCPQDDELLRFGAETALMLGIKDSSISQDKETPRSKK
jgi:hypothetical protein